MSDDPVLPGNLQPKLYYSIGEVSEAYDVEPHTLRYWEEEFPELRPGSTPGGQRRYRKEDLQIVGRIHYLVREEKYTVEGAREKLANWDEEGTTEEASEQIQQLCDESLQDINSFLDSL